MRFKAQLRNAAARTGVPAQLLLQDFFLERFLDRLCASDIRARFVFKGGDAIAGGPVEHALPSQFDPARTYRVWGYPVETILAEKVEAIFALGELGTRPRDYYDVLMVLENLPVSPQRFAAAFRATVAHRGSRDRLGNLPSRLDELSRSPALLDEWTRYRRRYPYAADIPFDRPISALRTLLSFLH